MEMSWDYSKNPVWPKLEIVVGTGRMIREHPKVANCPQTRSLGLYKLNPPARVLRQSAQADFGFIAAISNRQVFLQK